MISLDRNILVRFLVRQYTKITVHYALSVHCTIMSHRNLRLIFYCSICDVCH